MGVASSHNLARGDCEFLAESAERVGRLDKKIEWLETALEVARRDGDGDIIDRLEKEVGEEREEHDDRDPDRIQTDRQEEELLPRQTALRLRLDGRQHLEPRRQPFARVPPAQRLSTLPWLSLLPWPPSWPPLSRPSRRR